MGIKVMESCECQTAEDVATAGVVQIPADMPPLDPIEAQPMAAKEPEMTEAMKAMTIPLRNRPVNPY